MATIADPVEYPSVFSLDDRRLTPVKEDVASVILAMNTGNPLFSVACRYSDIYSLDCNPFSPDVAQASPGRKVVYELYPSTQDPETASVLMKTWISPTEFKSYTDGSVSRIRQAASPHGTAHSLSVSSLFDSMSPVIDAGVRYYPSGKISYNTRKLSDSSDGFNIGSVTSGGDELLNLFSPDVAGVSMLTFYYEYEWFLDSGRAVRASSVPGTLPSISGDMLTIVMSTKDGRLIHGGTVFPAGTATFDGIPSGDGAPLVESLYAGLNAAGDVFSYSESVAFNGDGTPNQTGNAGAAYLLTEWARITSSSSSSSSSCSSSSSSGVFSP